MCVYGYCRISRKTQSIERQSRNIKREYPDSIIIEEAFTGTTIERPQFKKLLKKVKEGDTIIFDSVSRMSRNSEEGWKVYEKLFSRGVRLVFLKEHHIDTDTYKKSLEGMVSMTGTLADSILKGVNEYLRNLSKEQIRLTFLQSEKEVEDLHQRTKEGIETARLNGKQIGGVEGRKLKVKKAEPTKKIIRKHSKDFNGTLNDIECRELCKVSRNTYYKYKREMKKGL